MASSITAEEIQLLIRLAQTTYKSSNTLQIEQASIDFKNFMVSRYPKSFSKLQELITLQCVYDPSTRKSLVNLLKVSADYFQTILQGYSLYNQEIISSHKQLLHCIEHAFDNQRIEPILKRPISVAYVNMFCLINPDNYQRLISKSKYFFNTNSEHQALDLLQIYHQKKVPFKYKVQFYAPCIHTLLQFLFKKLSFLNDEKTYDAQFAYNLKRLVELFENVWCFLTFQTYQSLFLKQVKNMGLLYQVLSMMLGSLFPQNLLCHVYRVLEHLLSGMLRCQLLKWYDQYATMFLQICKKEVQRMVSGVDTIKSTINGMQQMQVSKINYLITCYDNSFNFPLAQCTMLFIDYYTKLIFPNFKAITQYLVLHSNNIQEISAFLQDLSFYMESDCIEVAVNKFIVTLFRSSEQLRVQVRIMIGSFLFQYLPAISQGQIKSTKSSLITQVGLEQWQQIGKHIDQKDMILSVLQLIALLVSELMKDFQFMSSLQTFMGQNSEFFLQKDEEIAFYALLIYKNYSDDIFSNNVSSSFKAKLNKIALNSQNRVLRQFSLQIIYELLSKNPPFQDVFLTIQQILSSMLVCFESQLVKIVEIVLTNYNEEICKLRETVPLVKLILTQFSQSLNQIQLQDYYSYLRLIKLVLRIKGFESYLYEIVSIVFKSVQAIQFKNSIQGEEILSVFMAAFQQSAPLPQQLPPLLMKLRWELQDIDVVNCLKDYLSFVQDSQFANWLFVNAIEQQFSIQSCLLIQTIIFYHMPQLNPNAFKYLFTKIYRHRMINRLQKDFIHGKLNIILLMSISFGLEMTHSHLKHGNWQQLQRQVRQNTRGQAKYSNNTIGQKQFIDEIYQLVYLDQSVYCWKYDIQVFLIVSIQMFLAYLQEDYQFKYANLAFIACTKNILRMYQIYHYQIAIRTREEEECDLFPQKQYFPQEEHHFKTTNMFHRPQGLTKDCFQLYAKLIKKLKTTQESKQWMKQILHEVFDEQDAHHVTQILNMKLVEGRKLRKIYKVG